MAQDCTHAHGRAHQCFIISPDLLKKLSQAKGNSRALKRTLQSTWLVTSNMRKGRETARLSAISQKTSQFRRDIDSPPPEIFMYDCQKHHSIPGRPIADPAKSTDAGVRIAYQTTKDVAKFYKDVLGRSSVDGRGIDLVSSMHYREFEDEDYDNAFWDGRQMVYGDGDGQVFKEFYNSPDVIAHELTHGVTQFESHLAYEGESGALNEHISDMVGAVFNQKVKGLTADKPEGWLIGAAIMGAKSAAAGKTCLRDMASPGNSHCLSPQPSTYNGLDPTADVHINSGIPNLAFCKFAQAIGGNSWEMPLNLWYRASIGGHLKANATILDFANATLAHAHAMAVDPAALKSAWRAVAVPL